MNILNFSLSNTTFFLAWHLFLKKCEKKIVEINVLIIIKLFSCKLNKLKQQSNEYLKHKRRVTET